MTRAKGSINQPTELLRHPNAFQSILHAVVGEIFLKMQISDRCYPQNKVPNSLASRVRPFRSVSCLPLPIFIAALPLLLHSIVRLDLQFR